MNKAATDCELIRDAKESMPVPQHILIVDDDIEFSRTLAAQLEEDGRFVVATANCIAAAEALRAARETGFDAYLLDVGLPDGDGRQLCERLRKRGVETPILMLTASDAETDIVRGLAAGANDYIVKPFRLPVLMARLRSQLRGFEDSMHRTISVGPYTFHPAEKILRDPVQRRPIRLTDKETRILRRLCRTPGEGVARQVLLSEVWGYSKAISTHTLETHIYRLRQKMERDPTQPELIRSAGGCYALHPTQQA